MRAREAKRDAEDEEGRGIRPSGWSGEGQGGSAGEHAAERGFDRTSGVRLRGAAPVPDLPPCTSFKEAYARHRDQVWRRIRRKLGPDDPAGVDDVYQQVFLRLDRRICDGGGKVPDPLWPVLCGFVTDEVLNYRRTQKRQRCDGAPTSEKPSSKPNPEQLLGRVRAQDELRRRVAALLARLSPKEAQVLALADLDELPTPDIARDLGVTEVTVRVRLHRAREKLTALYLRLHGPRRTP